MPVLKGLIAKLDEVDESLRGFYVQKGDKFALQVEGVKTEADILALQTALTKERAANAASIAAAKVANDKLALYGEVTPEQVTAQAEKLANFEAAGTPELTKNFEKIVGDRVAAVIDTKLKTETAKLQKTITDLTTVNATVTADNDKFKATDKNRTIDDAVRASATKAKVLDAAVPDALIHAHGVFEIVDGKVQSPEGLTPDDWIESRKSVSGHWWPGARGAGAGSGTDFTGNAGDNPWSREGWNVTKQGNLVRQDSAKAQRLAESVGSKVGATAPAPVAK